MVDDKQIKSLNQRIQKAKDESNPAQNKPPSPIGRVMKIVVEIVAAMAVGVVIGMLVDNYFDTRPIFIIIFFLLGSAAGILNVFRVAKSLQKN
tara:strand:- start:1109 stop:1387 length:279 start_codon:yes stop_codon:yes gene_type:complete